MSGKKHKDPKISKMLLDVAGDYIAMGGDLEAKQQYLNSAVSAWNIACLDSAGREKALRQYRKSYHRLNPSQTHRDCTDVEENLRLLISKKDRLYPKVRIQIAGATIEERDGRDYVSVASFRMR